MTFALAVAAFVFFYAFLFPKPRNDLHEIERPLSTEPRPDGYLALRRWLEHENLPVVSLRNRFDRLSSDAFLPAANGNLLIMVTPHLLPARASELDALDTWIRKGNTLLLLAALDDTPAWATLVNYDYLQEMRELTGLKFAARQPDAKKSDRADD